MNYHASVKPLHDQLAKLTFTVKHLMTRHSVEDGFGVDVTKKTMCNGLSLSDFKTNFESVVATIEDKEKSTVEKVGQYYKKELLEIVIHLDRMKNNLFGDGYKGNVLEIPEKNLKEDDAYKLGALDYKNIIDARETKEEFYKIIAESIDTLKMNLTDLLLEENEQTTSTVQKLKWKAKTSVVSYLMLELANNNWLDIKLRNGLPNLDKLANTMNEIFEFDNEITPKSIKNSFTPAEKEKLKSNKPEITKLKIPDANTLG